MKLDINKKYAIFFGLISLVIIALLVLSFTALVLREGRSLRQHIAVTEQSIYEETQGKTIYNISSYLSKNLFVPLYRLDIEELNRFINDLRDALPITSFLIADPTGKVLTDGTDANEAYGTAINLDRTALRSSPIVETRLARGRRLTFAITAGNHVAGYAEIIYSDATLLTALRRHDAVVEASWNQFTKAIYRVIIIWVLIVLIVAALLSILFSRTLSRPLTRLTDAARRVASGDFAQRVTITTADEIGELAASFNRMVSDLRLSTERLQKANSKLKALDQLKSDFISVVSHELRTPITSIKAFAELILIKPNMAADRKVKFLSVINSESERLARLINDILDLTKIEAGKLSWNITALSINGVIETSITTVQPLADKKQLTLNAAGEPSLPNIFGDRDRLIQVVTNLLSNAVKYTPPGGRIDVACHEERIPRHQVVISVSDTGSGIPGDSLKHIFEKFQRSDDFVADTTEGTGLGLAISRLIVEYHGGSIRVESSVGSGSTFTVSLPVETALTAEGARQSAVARL